MLIFITLSCIQVYSHVLNDRNSTKSRHCGCTKGSSAKSSVVIAENDENISLPSSSNDSSSSVSIHVQYLACVATFDSYQNEQGNHVRYLAKWNIVAINNKQRGGSSSSSLAPFFDDTKDDDDSDSSPSFPGISAVAIGCGIEAPEDVVMIESFIHTLAGENRDRICVGAMCCSQSTVYKHEARNTSLQGLESRGKESSECFENHGTGENGKVCLVAGQN